jgi:hypothetical protein
VVGTSGNAGDRFAELTASGSFRAAAERHVRRLEAGADAEPFGRPVRRAADAGRRERHVAVFGLVDEFLDGLDAFRGRDQQYVRYAAE